MKDDHMLATDMRQAEQTSPHGASSEESLWQEYRESGQDDTALSHLMEYYVPLVTETVNRMSARLYHQVEPADLLGVAILGLYRAIQGFSPEHGVPFDAYARRRIKGAILDELRRRDPLTREQRARVHRLRNAYDSFCQENGRLPTDEELGEQLDMSPEKVAETRSLEAQTVSLHEEAFDGLTYEELIPDTTTPSPRENADREMAHQALREAIPQLDVREQQLLFFRHSQALSVAEIAAVFDISPGRVSQMYNRTLHRLRVLMKIGLSAGATA